jgi:hypothetical protein
MSCRGVVPSPPSSLWHFPVSLFVPRHPPVDSSHDHYLGLNRVGGLISEAMKSVPSRAELKPVDMSHLAADIAAAGPQLSTSQTRCIDTLAAT